MKVRTITVGISLPTAKDSWSSIIDSAVALLNSAIKSISDLGFEVQTVRVITNPFHDYCSSPNPIEELEHLWSLIAAAKVQHPAVLVNVGPMDYHTPPTFVADLYNRLPQFSVTLALRSSFDFAAAELAAKTMIDVSRRTSNGEGNFNFATLFNCPPDIPFFPAAYHATKAEPMLAIGTQNIDLYMDCLERGIRALHAVHELGEGPHVHTPHLDELEAIIRRELIASYQPLQKAAQTTCAQHKARYHGIDVSLAPAPGTPSIVDVFDRIGLAAHIGAAGSLSTAYFLTKSIQSISPDIKICGYSGLMLPPLEDSRLVKEVQAGHLSVRALLDLSAVCGIGLDTVPVPGDVDEHALIALLLDVAAISFKHSKPLSCRLFPVPNKKAGDMTSFANPHMCDGPVMKI